MNNNLILSKNVTSHVRPARLALLIDSKSPYAKSYIEGALQSFSRTWGGHNFIIIPSDGKTIAENFWQLLEAYSPDTIGHYLPSLYDLMHADPEQYARQKQANFEKFGLSEEEFEKIWSEQVRTVSLRSYEISEDLSRELKNRLSPFYFEEHVVSQNISRDASVGFPFTDLVDILPYAIDKPQSVMKPLRFPDTNLDLLALSLTGNVSDEFANQIDALGVVMEEFTEPDDLKVETYFNNIYKSKGNGPDHQLTFPEQVTSIGLSGYYDGHAHFKHDKDITIIIGDSLEDYCYYYSLSKIHDRVYWVPDSVLRAHRSFVKKKDAPPDSLAETCRNMASFFCKQIGYSHGKAVIRLLSSSLTSRQLTVRSKWLDEACWVHGTLRKNVKILSTYDSILDCRRFVIETNNYSTQQDMIFQEGTSVGRLQTPKPRNFTYIHPSDHRWITTINIESFLPMQLPPMGSEVIPTRVVGHESRYGNDGFSYICPDVMYFGGDIDAVTVKPTLHLLNDEKIFDGYFEYSGFSLEKSDKGSYLEDTIKRFGSLEQTASFFRDKVNRDIFDQFLYKTARKDEEVIYLEIERRACLSFNAIQRKLANEKDATELADFLIEKDIMRRGLIFQCSRCRLAAWYDIAVVTKTFTCTRCDLVQSYNAKSWKSPSQPRWYFKLAETVYLFYESNSYLTALSLDYLRRRSKKAFHFITESNINNFPKLGKHKEADVLAVSDGKLIIGECKNCKPPAGDLLKYAVLHDSLVVKPSEFILFTTETKISESVKSELSKIPNSSIVMAKDIMEV